MDSKQNLPVPLIRECVVGGGGSSFSVGALLAAVVVFIVSLLLGFGLTLLFHSNLLFLISALVGLGTGFLVFNLGSRLSRALPGPQQIDKVMLVYGPLLGRLNSAGFEAASDHAKAIVRLGLAIAKSQPSTFSIVDDSLRFFLARFIAVVQTRDLIGDSTDLRRQIGRLQATLDDHLATTRSGKSPSAEERASLDAQIAMVQARLDRIELVNRAALQLTGELAALRLDCEKAVVEKVVGDEESARSAALLKEQIEREKRVQEELKLLGL